MLPFSHKITAIYASTSGNTEVVVERVVEIWREQGCQLQLIRAEKASPTDLAQNSYFLLATSTWEHGELNPFFKAFVQELKKTECQDKYAAFIGLGDTRYEPVLFCGGMEKLNKTWLEQQGKEVGTALKINGDPFPLLDTDVVRWSDHTLQQFFSIGKKTNVLEKVRRFFSL